MQEEIVSYFEKRRSDFPILSEKINGKKLVYFDNAATSQKPQCVIDSLSSYYSTLNSNVHRGIHTLSEKSTDLYEEARRKAARFIGAKDYEIVFTKGTTESINMIAYGLEDYVNEGDEIMVSVMEHHANLVPWQELCRRKKAKLVIVPLDLSFRLDMGFLREKINDKTKILAFAHVSNVLGCINPVKEIVKLARLVGAFTVIDGAQAIPHMGVDVKKLDCDFYSFSAHKMFAPTGVGVLYGKKKSLEKLKPFLYGGSMISEVKQESSRYADVPYRLEAGTPNFADVIAFSKAIDYIEEIGIERIERYEKILTEHFLGRLEEFTKVKLFGPADSKNRSAVFTLELEGVHSQDVSVILDKMGIAVRAGSHCAMPLGDFLKSGSSVRVSLAFYNTIEEIDYFFDSLKKVWEMA